MGIFWVVLIIQGIIFGGFCSFIASQKNRDTVSWFFLGFFFSLIAVLALIAIPKDKSDVGRVCPYCAEQVKVQATICRFCQKDLPLQALDNKDKALSASTMLEEYESADKIIIMGAISFVVVLVIICGIYLSVTR